MRRFMLNTNLRDNYMYINKDAGIMLSYASPYAELKDEVPKSIEHALAYGNIVEITKGAVKPPVQPQEKPPTSVQPSEPTPPAHSSSEPSSTVAGAEHTDNTEEEGELEEETTVTESGASIPKKKTTRKKASVKAE